MIHLQNEGPTTCPALIMVMHNGKTNKHGKTELSGCIRNKIVELCPIMMFSSYIFQRFHNEDEPLLTFTTSGIWFGVKVLKTGNNRTTKWKYSSHYDAVKKAIVAVDAINTTKVTHIGRG
ncbi:hypothetical protein INT47_011851 [Mucor saturninus]|uniref:Ndc10 domain-containing protein n=1 Tax=Mucor saturninus TaxID=64648 RepID=A0A8H7RAT6_9FUNG|nr:hypothetical protein INT47_011851 [Mucor saturninus]